MRPSVQHGSHHQSKRATPVFSSKVYRFQPSSRIIIGSAARPACHGANGTERSMYASHSPSALKRSWNAYGSRSFERASWRSAPVAVTSRPSVPPVPSSALSMM